MNTAHRSLFSLAVRHDFRGGAYDEFSFVVPPATRAALTDMRAQLRERDGVLHVLIAVDDGGQPVGECTGRQLIFGLAPRNPWFAQYTAPYAIGASERPLFGNDASRDNLDALPRGVELCGLTPAITPQLTARPLDLRVTTPAGAQVALGRLDGTDTSWPFSAGLTPGEYILTEIAADSSTARRRLFIEPGLAASGCWGIVALTASAGHVANGHAFTLHLAARRDVLRYYVVVKPANNADFNSIEILDTGATDDGRDAPVTFKRVLPPFGSGRLSAALLDAGGTRSIVLFEAETAVARRARGPHGFELHRNGELLIGNLPQPGAERTDAQFVVHLR